MTSLPEQHTPSAAAPVSLALLRRLVGFDTVSARSNLAAIGFIRDYLEALGAACRLTFDDDGRKANLFATLGPADRPGVVLSGHTDVVPVEGQPWLSDPFALVERDGRLFGRGTCDMKAFIAASLALAPEFLARGLTAPLHFAFSYDEEIGCVGVRRLIDDLGHLGARPQLCIVGEPTEMKVIVAHKGKKSLRCRVRGLECHSALSPQGVNAVEAAAEVIAHMKGMQRRLRDQGPLDPAFDPPYTTIHTGVIQGGTALNIVPLDCWFEFEIRTLPGHDPEALLAEIKDFAETRLLPEMQAVNKACGFAWDDLNTTAGLDMAADSDAARMVAALSGSNTAGKVSFGTEAGLFQQAGIPTIVCGPGSIEQAHKPNEFIELDQIRQCEAFLRRLMDRMCRS